VSVRQAQRLRQLPHERG